MPMSAWLGLKFSPGTVTYLQSPCDSSLCNANKRVVWSKPINGTITYLHSACDLSWCNANEHVVWDEVHTRYGYIYPICLWLIMVQLQWACELEWSSHQGRLRISNLHVILHCVMPMSMWIELKFTPVTITYLRYFSLHLRIPHISLLLKLE
jgi:hypothetical protein